MIISIAPLDAIKAEGNSGTTPFTFKVTRTGSTTGTNTVQWQVASTDATGSDFAGGSFPSGLVTFNPSDTASKTITINVVGDLIFEPAELFTVKLSAPSGGATIGTSCALAFIVNDDGPPPVVTPHNLSATPGQQLALSDLFSVSGSAISQYKVWFSWAAGGAPALGTLTDSNGSPVMLGQPVTLTSLSGLVYTGSTTPGTDRIWLQAFNGTWSNNGGWSA